MMLYLEKKELRKAREEELKKNEGAILKFVKIATAKETEEVSSHSESFPQVETEGEAKLEQTSSKTITK